MPKTPLRAVPDTNILLASEMSPGSSSPNREYFERWKADEFVVLFSADTLLEYVKKLREKDLAEERIKVFLGALPTYPVDSDDIAFLLCADNGHATHLVTYDRHLQEIDAHYSFRICETTDFLRDLRRELRP
ncbi:MAG: hypothetical protein GY719_12405 [bacterium]|nr:hypothetical protein [bacterium]